MFMSAHSPLVLTERNCRIKSVLELPVDTFKIPKSGPGSNGHKLIVLFSRLKS